MEGSGVRFPQAQGVHRGPLCGAGVGVPARPLLQRPRYQWLGEQGGHSARSGLRGLAHNVGVCSCGSPGTLGRKRDR